MFKPNIVLSIAEFRTGNNRTFSHLYLCYRARPLVASIFCFVNKFVTFSPERFMYKMSISSFIYK
ncbi:MAG: hypothetical protein K0Q59_1467 [Paenibacillus sp.]|nr:hypothetical protein [Paenibacillus sp.]